MRAAGVFTHDFFPHSGSGKKTVRPTACGRCWTWRTFAPLRCVQVAAHQQFFHSLPGVLMPFSRAKAKNFSQVAGIVAHGIRGGISLRFQVVQELLYDIFPSNLSYAIRLLQPPVLLSFASSIFPFILALDAPGLFAVLGEQSLALRAGLGQRLKAGDKLAVRVAGAAVEGASLLADPLDKVPAAFGALGAQSLPGTTGYICSPGSRCRR